MCSFVLLVKIIAVSVLFVASVIGYHAHFESKWTLDWNEKGDSARDVCKANSTCPGHSVPFEASFVYGTSLIFVLSIVVIIYALCVGEEEIKRCDGGYHILAGLLVLVVSVLIIISAINIDKYRSRQENKAGSATKSPNKTENTFNLAEARAEDKFKNKLAAGGLGIVDALLYFATTGFIWTSRT